MLALILKGRVPKKEGAPLLILSSHFTSFKPQLGVTEQEKNFAKTTIQQGF